MDLNIVTFFYLFLRLAPFILVCFFSLASIFNQDFKGIIYLVGLLFACFFTTMCGNIIPNTWTTEAALRPAVCSTISINGSSDLSILPLGQTVFGYTFAYLLYFILLPTPNNLVMDNIPTIIFFPVLILCDMWWNVTNTCYNLIELVISVILGSICGIIWGAIINSSKTESLKYFSVLNNGETCKRAAKQSFKCTVSKNSKLLGTTSVTPAVS